MKVKVRGLKIIQTESGLSSLQKYREMENISTHLCGGDSKWK